MSPSKVRLIRFALTASMGASVMACDQAPEDPVPPLPRRSRLPIRVPDPVPKSENPDTQNLLQAFVERARVGRADTETARLPFHGRKIIAAFLTTVAKDRLEDLHLMLAPDATYGLPDRRQIGARPVFGPDGGEAFLASFRSAAQQMPGTAKSTCPPIAPAALQRYVTQGAEPMWCYHDAAGAVIVYKLRTIAGKASIEYIGFSEEPIAADLVVAGYGAPPPRTVPPVRRKPGQPQRRGR